MVSICLLCETYEAALPTILLPRLGAACCLMFLLQPWGNGACATTQPSVARASWCCSYFLSVCRSDIDLSTDFLFIGFRLPIVGLFTDVPQAARYIGKNARGTEIMRRPKRREQRAFHCTCLSRRWQYDTTMTADPNESRKATSH